MSHEEQRTLNIKTGDTIIPASCTDQIPESCSDCWGLGKRMTKENNSDEVVESIYIENFWAWLPFRCRHMQNYRLQHSFWHARKGILHFRWLCVCTPHGLLAEHNSAFYIFLTPFQTLCRSLCSSLRQNLLCVSPLISLLVPQASSDTEMHFPKCICSFSVLSLWLDIKSGRQINYLKAMSPLSCFC